MLHPGPDRSGRRSVRRLIVVGLSLVVVVVAVALAWHQLSPGAQREREIAKALQAAVADCGPTDHEGDPSKDVDGGRLVVTCGPSDNLGQFVGMANYDTPALAEAGFRRQAADPRRALCRTSTEVFLLELFWPDGADPAADEREQAADRKFCAAVGAGRPRYATGD